MEHKEEQLHGTDSLGGKHTVGTGGKGNYTTGNILLEKNTNLGVFVGGQNGYNGGGASQERQGTGGGASDIRLGGNDASNRILVAAGGGGASATPVLHQHTGTTSAGGGCFTGINYHSHTGSPISGGGCYGGAHFHTDSCYAMLPCGKPLHENCTCNSDCARCNYDDRHDWKHCLEWECQDREHHSGRRHDWNAQNEGDPCPVSVRKLTCSANYVETCGRTPGVTIDSYYTTCGRTPGVTIDTYSGVNGNVASVSNNTAYQGTTGGGGGYYGGTTTNAGTNYTSASFTEASSTNGQKEGNGYIKITLVSSYPDVTLTPSTTEYTNQDVVITATAIEHVGTLAENPYSWNEGTRIDSNIYISKTNAKYTVDVTNSYNNTQRAEIRITNIDKIRPIVNSVVQTKVNDKQMKLTVTASDSPSSEYAASGVIGYAITTNEVAPTNFQSSNEFNITKNGRYYAWVKDRAGNISQLSDSEASGGNSSILVKDIQIDVKGNITWNDQENRYNSREASKVNLYRKIGENGREEKVGSVEITAGQTNYSFTTRECNDAGERYIFRIEQEYVKGYETLYIGNNVTSIQTANVTIGITNNLILPGYTSKIEYNLIDGFRGEYLKNTELEMTATIEASRNNREKTGLNQSKATFLIDEGFEIDKNSIKVTYVDGATGNKKEIRDYVIQNNNIMINFGTGSNYVTKAGDKLEIKLKGRFASIKEYNNSITLTGNLTDYKGTNTSINLGEVTKQEKNFTVSKQKPQARIEIRKTDSITEEKLTDATFTLYEWNGTEYVEKEILRDEDGDGIYTSKYYEWTSETEGKYRVAETGVPLKHKDLKFSMEYSIDQLNEENYTITPEYSNGAYRIAYEERNPDDFDRTNGIVENEPYKIKVSIDNRDQETGEQISSNGTYDIYEWDNTTNEYVEYVSKVNGNKVEMERGSDKIYTTNGWLYYTPRNEGKYKVVENTAPYGYIGDYNEEGNKREYEINVLEIIEAGRYEGQEVENESTIKLRNNEEKTIQNKRVDTKINIELIDKETRSNKTQGDAKLEGAEYGIYAREQVNHADGITSRYEGEAGVLYKQDELVKTVETNEEGKIEVEDLECGKYYVKQIKAPEGYLKDENTYEIDVRYDGQEKKVIEVSNTYENMVKKQAFQILKQKNIGENETAPLANAGFSIYKIKDLSIVKEGKISKNEDGTYTLNDETAKNDTRITKKANKNGTYKIADLINYYYKIVYTEENMQVLPQGENSYKPYNLSQETKAKNYVNAQEGQDIREIVTGQDGYALSEELAYGEYIVIETSVPHNYEAILPFAIKVETDSRTPQNLRYLLDLDFESKTKIYIKDMETKQTILKEDAKFVIKDTETGELVTSTGSGFLGGIIFGTNENPHRTNENGNVITPMKLEAGNYELIQLDVPESYILSGYEGYSANGEILKTPQENVQFEIGTNQMYFVDEDETNIIVAVQKNKAQVGTLKVNVQGEKLIKADKNEEQAKDKAQELYTFNYEKDNLEGVEVGLYAKEDIYSQDGQGTKVYEKDELVQSKTTNAEGNVYFDNIPIGNYYVKDINTIHGYKLSQETKDISITYGINEVAIEEQAEDSEETVDTEETDGSEDAEAIRKEAQKTPVTKHEMEKEVERRKINIVITNKDKETGKPVVGQVIGIYAKEDILDKDGNVIIAKDELVEIIETDEEGKAKTKSDLPVNEYYAKEIKPAPGYLPSPDIIDINPDKPGGTEDGKDIIEPEVKFDSQKTNIYVKPIDENGNIIANSKLQIVDEEGTVIGEWKTINQAQKIQKLEIGKTYILKQAEPILGYASIEEIRFCIKENGDLEEQVSDEKNTLKPIHYTTKLEIHLKDKEDETEMQGIKFEIIQKEETEEKIIEEFITSGEGYYREKLPIGKYILRQKKGQEENIQNQGYVGLKDIEFEVKDTKEIQKLTIEQERTKLEIELIDKKTREHIEDVRLELYKLEKEIKEGGQEEDKLGEKVVEFITTKENTKIGKLPEGEYILREVIGQEKALYEKGYVTNRDLKFKIQDSEQIQKLTIEQEESKLEIEIIDNVTGEKVEGSTIQIINQQTGEVEEEYTTEKDTNKLIRKLGLGNYIIHYKGVDLEKGYIKAEDIVMQLIDTRRTQTVRIEQAHTNVSINVLDKDTKEGVTGATMVVKDKEGNEVGESWVTEGKAHIIEKLPVGEYCLEEKEAPTEKGYVKTKEVYFKVEETEEIQVVEMLQDYTQIKIELKEETNEVITGIELVIKDKEGNEIGKVTTKEEAEILTRLPVGEYVIESVKVPYGYKPIHIEIEIKDEQGIQELDKLKIEREEFDLKVEEWVQRIERNGKAEYENTKEETKMKKVDIKDKKIRTEEIKITYKIRVSNISKITGQAGKVEVKIPQGMKFESKDNNSYWEEEKGKVTTTKLANLELKENANVDIEVTFRWKNGIENFGTKKVEAGIIGVTSDIGFKESNEENNKAETEVIIGVSTGEMNLVYTCWVLLAILIIMEIVLGRKTKLKKFGIKDKTLKYREK